MLFALTKAPQSIAAKPPQDTEVSFHFEEIPLKSVLELIFEANPKDVIGYENVPDIVLSFEAWNVSAIQIENLILKCTGLKMIANGEKFEIVKNKNFKDDFSKVSECVNTIND